MKTTLGFLLILLCIVMLTAGRRFNRSGKKQSLFCSHDADCDSDQLCRRMFRDCEIPKKCFPATNIGNTCTRNSDCWDTDPMFPCDGTRCRCQDGVCTCGECFTEVDQRCEPTQSQAGRTGTSFHTGYMFSLSTSSGSQYLYILSPCANVNITVPFLSILDEPHEVINSKVIEFPPTLQVKSDGVPSNKTVYIKSDSQVTVYWLNSKTNSADGGRILSDEELGQEYILASDRSGNTRPDRFEQFLIVSLQNGTSVQIEYSDGSQETISLEAMEAFRKKGTEFSGTIVTSNELIAVKSGHECFVADGGRCDLMSEQIPPVSSLGCIHIIGYMKPFLTSYVRIAIPFDHTDVTIFDEDGNVVDCLVGMSRGDTFVKSYSNVALSVISTERVLVIQYGDDYEEDPVRDSSMMQILSIDRYVSTYDFYVPENFEQAILEIIIESTLDPTGLLLDGMMLSVTETVSATVPGYGTYDIIYSNVSPGSHTLTHADVAVYTAFVYARRVRAEYAIVL
ncbi:uncharacterized protein LOC132744551 [Ruditapes philippinarum]|uniref:uncharacterized protein LOC132744551 n=1 Tax=Ruditapes philippinarum TaxID=129788 RepID=UPI00295A733C|nr:uncharacterized protein LOC132744551 [Ruditapes philippinarum]